MEKKDEKQELQQCQECDYRATRKENIKAHVLRIHRKEFNFKCSQCPKQYVINSELRFHIQSFHQEKNIKCPHCEATFSVKKYLKVSSSSSTQVLKYLGTSVLEYLGAQNL